MTNFNEALKLDTISDELKNDEAMNAWREKMLSPSLDIGRTHVNTLAGSLMFHISQACAEYDATLEKLGIPEERQLTTEHMLAAVIACAIATARMISRNASPNKATALKVEERLMSVAASLAMRCVDDVIYTTGNYDKMCSAGLGVHRDGKASFVVLKR